MGNSFCLEALKEAIARDGTLEIFNTDPGRQLTSDALTGKLKEDNIRIRMDGKGSWRDNVLVERLWRHVKYEEVYLNFYKRERPHSSLDGIPPDQFYYDTCGHYPWPPETMQESTYKSGLAVQTTGATSFLLWCYFKSRRLADGERL
ncbi:MAG: hypothetical protein QGH37_31995 [Candidatus Poribacteria bacterium]|jgi:putative transposase|nr:hypothetical protein [Candidatus Poribacteria bacterium]